MDDLGVLLLLWFFSSCVSVLIIFINLYPSRQILSWDFSRLLMNLSRLFAMWLQVVAVTVAFTFPSTLSYTFHLIPEIYRGDQSIFYTSLLYRFVGILTSLSDRLHIWFFLWVRVCKRQMVKSVLFILLFFVFASLFFIKFWPLCEKLYTLDCK